MITQRFKGGSILKSKTVISEICFDIMLRRVPLRISEKNSLHVPIQNAADI